jgi:hypothetical protein
MRVDATKSPRSIVPTRPTARRCHLVDLDQGARLSQVSSINQRRVWCRFPGVSGFCPSLPGFRGLPVLPLDKYLPELLAAPDDANPSPTRAT